MYLDRYLRLIAGSFVLVSLALGYFISPAWFILAMVVGVSLIMGGLINWCPMISILRWLGVRALPEGCACE